MDNIYNNFCEKFRIETLRIYESEFWCWSLRPVQVTIGSGILSLKRAEKIFSSITDDESRDLINIVKVIERTLINVFNYQRINYLMLMMVDFHVHYHVIPRFDREVEHFNRIWKDNDWPSSPVIVGIPEDSKVLQSIQNTLKANLSL